MNSLKDFTIQITIFSVVVSLVLLLIPIGQLKKQIKGLFGVFFLVTILRTMPSLKKTELSFTDTHAEISPEIISTVNDQIESENSTKITEIANKMLEKNKVSAKVMISTDISVDNVISINARVISNDENECQKAAILIEEEFGILPEMVVTE